MTLPVSGEQHDRAIEAGAQQFAKDREERPMRPLTEAVSRAIAAYFESLREQGVMLVEQPRCEACGGSGRYRDPRYWGTMPGSTACERCNGTGRARMVDVNEIVEMLRCSHRVDRPGGQRERVSYDEAADFIARRFASEDTAKEE